VDGEMTRRDDIHARHPPPLVRVTFERPTGSPNLDRVVAGDFTQVQFIDLDVQGLTPEGAIVHIANAVKIRDGMGVGYVFRSRAYRSMTVVPAPQPDATVVKRRTSR
jgi:hypothetical protein